MSALEDFSEEDQQKFLRVIHDSLAIDRHFQLFLWLQGDLQHFLPHDIMIAMVGNFAAGDLKFDMVSALPGIRTENCSNCDLKPISLELFDRWQRNGQQMLVFDGVGGGEVLTDACHCPIRGTFRRMQSLIVHGLRDMRSGEDALYVMMFSEAGAAQRVGKVFSMLLPQIDFACRRVTSFSRQPRALLEDVKPAATLEDAGLSQREMEILDWVRAGKTNHEIGVILNISAFTVKNHLQRIFRKIDVINRAQAVAKLETLVRPK
jgi:transcriptional regulator EpsA